MPSSTPDVAQHSAPASAPRWVVRGGLSAPIHLQDGYREHLGAPGIFGFSVQHQIGLTIEQLAAAGRFRHTHISYVTESELILIAKDLGHDLSMIKTPGGGYHYTVTARSTSSGVMIRQLPEDLATALSSVFKHMTNPARVE